METVGAKAAVFCLRAQGLGGAAKRPSIKDLQRAVSRKLHLAPSNYLDTQGSGTDGIPFAGTPIEFDKVVKPTTYVQMIQYVGNLELALGFVPPIHDIQDNKAQSNSCSGK